MSRWHAYLLPAGLTVGAILVAAIVLRDAPAADWLQVRAASVLVKDQAYVATVTLTPPVEGAFLSFDLHGHDADNRNLRCVASAPPQRISQDVAAYTFTLHLGSDTAPARVHAVVFLSASGSWNDRTDVVTSSTFPVVTRVDSPLESELLAVYPSQPDPEIQVSRPPWVRAVIACAWLVAGLVATMAWRQHPAPRTVPVLPLICVTLAAMAATDALSRLAEIARLAAHNHGWYDDRRDLQQLATAGLVCFLGLAAALGVRAQRRQSSTVLVLGLAFYLAVDVSGMLSLHEVDRFLGLPVWNGGILMDTLLRLASTLCAGTGIVVHMRAARARCAG